MDDDDPAVRDQLRRVSAQQAESAGPIGPADAAADSRSSVAAGVAGPHHALPRSQSGNDAIVVFVDKLTKMVHYVATTTNVTAPQLAADLHARGRSSPRRARVDPE